MYLVLASKSPRRKELLELAGYNFKIEVSNVDETVEETNPVDKVMAIAKKKGIDVYNKSNNEEAVILSADTIVVINNQVLGKPKDKDDARLMMKMLQNNTHQVYTAVYIKSNLSEDWFYEKTDVIVGEITDEEIEEYINTKEPYDKAGGYGIQGMFSKYISSINGDYYNVMGLPIHKVNNTLKKYDFTNVTKCPICNQIINKNSNFCSNCGNKINTNETLKECPHCSSLNKEQNKFCVKCGKNLTEQLIENEPKDKDLGVLSLVFGIITLFSITLERAAFLLMPLGIVSIILAIANFKRGSKVKTLLGLIFASLGLLVDILFYVYLLSY